jgi:GntR family transcriptional regulator
MQMSADSAPLRAEVSPTEHYSQVVDKSRPEPVYEQIADWMTYKITVGDWQSNDRLPSEPALAKAMGVSRSSLRKAMARLTSAHLLLQIQGKGTFVRSEAFEGRMEQRLRSVTEILDADHLPHSTTVLEQRMAAPPPKVCLVLGLQPGESVLYLKWLVHLKETPFLYTEVYLPGESCAILLHADLTLQTVYTTLERAAGIRIARAHDVFAAVSAPSAVARRLDVERGTPTLFIERTLFDDQGRKVLYAETWSRSDRLRLSMESYRKSDEGN